MRESRIHGFKPRIDSGFARVDLLSTPDKANNDGPIRMAIHAGNQELWLRVGEPGPILFSPHEIRGLPQVPARCASSKMTTCSAGGPESIKASSRK